MTDADEIVEAWRREAVNEGIVLGMARSLIDVYEVRFGVIPHDLRAHIETTHDSATLRDWHRLAATRSADEIAAAIRASRPS